MYLPSHFEESRAEVLHRLMRCHPLGLLVTQTTAPTPGAPAPVEANALPFHLDPSRGPHGTLVAHVARANPVWREARNLGGRDRGSRWACKGVQARRKAQPGRAPGEHLQRRMHPLAGATLRAEAICGVIRRCRLLVWASHTASPTPRLAPQLASARTPISAAQAPSPDAEVLVVFQGPQAYISPGWYATKAETGKVVPTWNYVLVEARGRLVVRDDAAWVHALVSGLTDLHEASRPLPWKVADAPADYIAATQRAIVGIEVELISLKGKWKVSQNRSSSDRLGVVQGLNDIGRNDMAALVQQSLPRNPT